MYCSLCPSFPYSVEELDKSACPVEFVGSIEGNGWPATKSRMMLNIQSELYSRKSISKD